MEQNWQVKCEADRLIQHAGMNCRYYQYMSYWWYLVDRILKFVLAVGAVLGLVIDEGESKWLSVSLIALSIALNVVPSDVKETFYSQLFKRWARVRELAEVLHLRTKYLPNDLSSVHDQKLIESIEKLAKETQKIHQDEILPMRWLIAICERQEKQMWGIKPSAECQPALEVEETESAAMARSDTDSEKKAFVEASPSQESKD